MKKKVLKIVYRVIPCMVCVMILISSMTMPAHAAIPSGFLDWNDYIEEIYIDDDTNYVTVVIPREFYVIKVQDFWDDHIQFFSPNGKDLEVYLDPARYNITFYSFPQTPLYIRNIPEGATINVTVDCSQFSTFMYSTPAPRWCYKQYSQDNKWLADVFVTYPSSDFANILDGPITVSGPLTHSTYEGEPVYGGAFGVEFFNFQILSGQGGLIRLSFLELSITFPLSAISADNVMYQQNQKLMKDIINGTTEQNEQVSGAVGSMNSSADKLDQLGDSLKVDQPDVSDISTDIGSLVNYNSILAYVGPFLAIWDNNSTLFGFLTIVLTLVIVSWVMFGKKG